MKALLFDLDGTIVDNMDTHMLAWVEYLKINGLNDSEENVYSRVAGKTTEEVIKMYFGSQLSQEEIKAHYQQKEDLYKKMYLPQMKENPGVSQLLQQAQRLGLPMAIASAAGLDNIEFVLNNLNISHYFSTIVSAGDVKKGKPDPEIFLLAAQRLGVEPSACLVFEDALVGVEGANNAGMKAVAITTGYPEKELTKYPAVIKVVDNYLNLDLAELM